MAYFPNGAAGDMYEARYCVRCVHGDNGHGREKGCPVFLAHVLYAYELCNQEKHPGKVILDLLIPDDENGFAAQCAMFVPLRAEEYKRQLKLFEGDR